MLTNRRIGYVNIKLKCSVMERYYFPGKVAHPTRPAAANAPAHLRPHFHAARQPARPRPPNRPALPTGGWAVCSRRVGLSLSRKRKFKVTAPTVQPPPAQRPTWAPTKQLHSAHCLRACGAVGWVNSSFGNDQRYRSGRSSSWLYPYIGRHRYW